MLEEPGSIPYVYRMKMRLLFLLAAIFLVVIPPALADQVVATTQTRLKQLGYYDGRVDGEMGSGTSAAIRRFQLANKLPVNGELTETTLRALNVSTPPVTRSVTRTTTRPVPPPQPPPPIYVQLADLYVGGPLLNAGPQVQVATLRRAQANLRTLGYYGGPIDGNPSPQFSTALKRYQKDAGFRANGRLDKTTLRALNLWEPFYDDGTY